jgi:hypothetical protein
MIYGKKMYGRSYRHGRQPYLRFGRGFDEPPRFASFFPTPYPGALQHEYEYRAAPKLFVLLVAEPT